MKSYTISPVTGVIDWASVPALAIDVQLWGTQTDITAQAQLCYDKEALHVHLSAVEANIRAEEEGPLGSPCQDSCLEFFFCPLRATGVTSTSSFPPPAVIIWVSAATDMIWCG